MASSDDFRKQLKAGNIKEALALALSNAVELKITTWVASGADDVEAAEAKPGHRLRTHLNQIEGKIANEIGDQFIGNGPYRELRQFHLEQIAEGNKIIQNNLKSLHKLFEVLVAMRYQTATPPVIEPESLGVESQLLPPTEDITETGLGIAPTESGVGGFVVSPNTVIQEDVAQEPPLPSGEPGSFLTTPADTEEALDSEADDDDWDDSVLELLESLPVRPPHGLEALDSQIDEDWGDFIEEEADFDPAASNSQGNQDWGSLTLEDLEPRPAEAEPNTEASTSQIDEDLGDFIAQELALDPLPSDSPENQDWGTLTLEDLQSLPVSAEPNTEASSSQIDEDLGDFIAQELALDPLPSDLQGNQQGEILTQQELESPPTEAEPNTEASSSQIDEDLGDFIAQELALDPLPSDLQGNQQGEILTQQELESPPTEAEPNTEASSSQIDEDWGWEDLIEEEPGFEATASDLQRNQDEGILTQQELESPSVSAEPTIEASSSAIDEDWGDLIEEEPDFEPASSDLQRNQDEGILTQQELESPSVSAEPTIEASSSAIDEDWGDFIGQAQEPEPDKPVPRMDSLDLEEDDEWDDWVVEDPSPLLDEPITHMDLLNLGEDEDWDDFAAESDPFVVESALYWSESDLEIDEDWDDFAAEELEPYSGGLDVDMGFDPSEPLEDLTSRDSALDDTDNPDLTKHLLRDSSTDKGSFEEFDLSLQMPEMTNPSQEASNAQGEVLSGETEQLIVQAEPTILDDQGVYQLEEGLFVQKPHKPLSAEASGIADSDTPEVANASLSLSPEDSERVVAAQESESLAMSADDVEAKPKPVERRVPPPPPPSRFPNQNN